MFGKSKDDKNQDQIISALSKNQQTLIKHQNVLIKNGVIYNDWIQYLDKVNKAQNEFDSKVTKSLNDINVKLADYLSMAKSLKDLQSQVAALQQNSHKHEGVDNVKK